MRASDSRLHGRALHGATAMTRIPFASALVVLAACASSEREIQKEFDAYVAERKSCTVTDDCVLASTGCPLGCGTAVNRVYQADVEAKARELIDEYQSGGRSCQYSCLVITAVCTEGRCMGEPQ
jgi:hypothetical protein